MTVFCVLRWFVLRVLARTVRDLQDTQRHPRDPLRSSVARDLNVTRVDKAELVGK